MSIDILFFIVQKAIKQIEDFIPSCEQEICDKELFLKAAKTDPKSLTRESLAHFTASAFVINQARTKVVGAYHNQYKSWGWLGGHADGDEDFLHVARKEVQEESGLENLKLLGDGIFSIESFGVQSHIKRGKFVPAHVHLDIDFVFIASEKEKLHIKEDENSNVAWLTFDELIEKTTEPWMIPVYQKIIAKIKTFK